MGKKAEETNRRLEKRHRKSATDPKRQSQQQNNKTKMQDKEKKLNVHSKRDPSNVLTTEILDTLKQKLYDIQGVTGGKDQISGECSLC